ncbi:MAG: succinate dehydrogenase assembly factor 2, partial [Pseudomonadota bacterium]
AHGFDALPHDGRVALGRLLELPDQDIFDWIAGREEPTDQELKRVVEALQATSAQLPWQDAKKT